MIYINTAFIFTICFVRSCAKIIQNLWKLSLSVSAGPLPPPRFFSCMCPSEVNARVDHIWQQANKRQTKRPEELRSSQTLWGSRSRNFCGCKRFLCYWFRLLHVHRNLQKGWVAEGTSQVVQSSMVKLRWTNTYEYIFSRGIQRLCSSCTKYR